MARPILVFVVAAVVAVAGILSAAGYPAQSAMDTVNVATATVNGKSEQILVESDQRSLAGTALPNGSYGFPVSRSTPCRPIGHQEPL